jgi:hypothetical protein
MRIWGMEKAAMEHEMHRQGEMSNLTASDADGDSEHAATRAAIAFRTLSDDSRSLELINRYELRYDRQYLRAHRRFLEVRDRRTPPPAPPSAPLSPTPPPPPPENTDFSKGTQEVLENKPAQANTSSHFRSQSVFIRFHPWPMFLTYFLDRVIRPALATAIIPLQHNPAR